MGPTRSKIHDLVSTSSFRPRALSLQERWCSWPSPRRQTCFARAWQARGSIHADFPVIKTPTYFMETVCNHHFREPPVVRTANGAKRSDKPPLSLKRKPATSAPGAGRRQRNVSDSPGSFCGALRSRYAGESSARLPLTVVLPYPFIRNHHTCFFFVVACGRFSIWFFVCYFCDFDVVACGSSAFHLAPGCLPPGSERLLSPTMGLDRARQGPALSASGCEVAL